jgi:hypothetical protein
MAFYINFLPPPSCFLLPIPFRPSFSFDFFFSLCPAAATSFISALFLFHAQHMTMCGGTSVIRWNWD